MRDPTDNIEAVVSDLTAGFEALTSEFSNLFAKYDALERNLQASKQEVRFRFSIVSPSSHRDEHNI